MRKYIDILRQCPLFHKIEEENLLSQEQLAEILCTKKATISAYENDHIDIKSSIVLEIAKALNCSGSYLLEGKKAEALDDRIMDALLELKNDQMREVALKQIQALALLG